jgi:hypothetical protein
MAATAPADRRLRQLAEVAVPQRLYKEILMLIALLRAPPAPA